MRAAFPLARQHRHPLRLPRRLPVQCYETGAKYWYSQLRWCLLVGSYPGAIRVYRGLFQFDPNQCFMPTGPSGTGGAASSALSLGLDGGPASPAASFLASEAAALGANIIVITNTSTK
jgi:hypothetical protein